MPETTTTAEPAATNGPTAPASKATGSLSTGSETTTARQGGNRSSAIGAALCIVTILLAVLDSNIVSSATVPIVRDLDPVHGVDRIPWLIAAYQLAATAALPLYGKLCDSLGSKNIFIGALATFLTGSALCGMAQSMGELIAARAFQGIGGGGLMSVTMVVLHQLGGPGGGRHQKSGDTKSNGSETDHSTGASPGTVTRARTGTGMATSADAATAGTATGMATRAGTDPRADTGIGMAMRASTGLTIAPETDAGANPDAKPGTAAGPDPDPDPDSKREAGKRGNLGGVVAGAGMALGPWLGGALSDHAGWRWIFYINLPVGIAVLAAAVLVLKLPAHTTRHRIDFLGAGLAAAFSSALLLVTEWGGQDYAWSSLVIVGLLVTVATTLGLFLWRQATAAEPILPLSLFSLRSMRYGFAVQGLVGVAMMGSIVYVMIYLQVVRGVAATSAGLFLVPMAIGMTAIGLLSGRLVQGGWSQKTFVLSGTISAAAALGLLTTLTTDTGLWTVRAAMLLMGLGFGQLIGQLIQLIQETAPPRQLGVATTGVRFFQTLGTALGASVFGAVLSRVYAAHGPGGTTSDISRLTGTAHQQALDAFAFSTDVVFGCATAVMILALLLATRLPGAIRNQKV